MGYSHGVTTTYEQSAAAPAEAKSPWLNRGRILDLIAAICRFYLAYIWLKAGISKVGNHMDVTQAIIGYEIFTPYWSDLLARIIGPLEIAGGLMLLLGLWLRPSAKLSAVVLTLFIIGIASVWVRGLDISCGCFSQEPSSGPMEYAATIARDIVYLAMSVFIIYRPFKKWAIYP